MTGAPATTAVRRGGRPDAELRPRLAPGAREGGRAQRRRCLLRRQRQDHVSYVNREIPVSTSLDGRPNDGPPARATTSPRRRAHCRWDCRRRLDGGPANEVLDGGPGSDRSPASTAQMRSRAARWTGSRLPAGGGGPDTLSGGPGGDSASGGDDGDALRGGGGTDRLDGGAGDDALEGEADGDELAGGPGGMCRRRYGRRSRRLLRRRGGGDVSLDDLRNDGERGEDWVRHARTCGEDRARTAVGDAA